MDGIFSVIKNINVTNIDRESIVLLTWSNIETLYKPTPYSNSQILNEQFALTIEWHFFFHTFFDPNPHTGIPNHLYYFWMP